MTNGITPRDWETPVRIVETKAGSGVFTLKPSKDGKYSHEDVGAILKALLAAKVPLDGWKVWLDGPFTTETERGKPVSPAKLAKLTKEADHIQLAYVRKPFAQPKLRFVKGGGTPVARKSSVREL